MQVCSEQFLRYPLVSPEPTSSELLYLHLKYKENMVKIWKVLGEINNNRSYWKQDK